MLDEPANGLDPEGIAWLRQFIKDYADEGNGVFVSSHLLSEMSQMADNLVVIGKGKLIADTTVPDLIARGSGGGVFVRSSKLAALERVLINASLKFDKKNAGVVVHKTTSDAVGKLAFGAGIPLYELTNQSMTLEEVFLELTENSQEFATHKGTKK